MASPSATAAPIPAGASGEADATGATGATGVLSGAVVAGLVAVVAGLLLTGAAAASLVADPGAVTRWGLPLARVVGDLAGAVTIGLLVVGACLLPADGWARSGGVDRGTGADRGTGRQGGAGRQAAADHGVLDGVNARAARLAGATGGLWVAASVVVLVLSYARISGVAPSDPQFSAQFGYFVANLDPLRSLLVSALLAAVAATGAAVATRQTTLGWMAVLALLALLPIALTGHSAGTVGHELAVDSLAAHLIGVTVWVGGLIALVVLRRSLGRHVGVVARRFSALALVAFVLVGASGVLNAYIRVGGWSGLATAYGVLILGKAALLVLLGVAGWWHRRWVLDRLDDEPTATRHFWRLAGAEVALMGLATGLAVALANSEPPGGVEPPSADRALAITGYAMPAPLTAASWLSTWRPDLLWASVAVLLLVGYLVGVRRLAARGDRWSLGRTIAWVLGCLVLVYATNGAPAVYGRVLFSSHMLGHMAMSMVVPPLLVLGAPVTLALRTIVRRADGSRGAREWLMIVVHSRLLAVLGHPLVAAGLFATSLIAFYYSPLFELSLRTHTGHVLMHVHFLLVGYLFASVLIGVDPGPARPPYPLRLVLLFATMAFHAFFGVALISGSQVLAPDVLAALGRTWGRSPLADQQFGGAVAWGTGEVPVLVLAVGIAIAWARSDDRESRRHDRQADRDGDVELTAYNEQLTRLAQRREG